MNLAREASARLVTLLGREQTAMADFLVALADFDRRRLWVELGYAGLFAYLHRELRLSKAAAYQRKVAAELLQRYAEVEAPLRSGQLCMTAIAHLAKVITPENRQDLVPRFFGLSSREAEALAVELVSAAAPPRRSVVTAVRVAVREVAPTPALPLAARNGEPEGGLQGLPTVLGDRAADGSARPAPTDAERGPGTAGFPAPEPAERHEEPAPTGLAARSIPPATAKPLTADLRRLHVTVSRRFLDKLEAASAALSHSHPGASAEQILEAGLDLLLDRAEKRKGVVQRPQLEMRPSAPDHVPARVKREVWRRDGGRCQWRLASGGVCGSTTRVELDHIIPRALGGQAMIDNLRCLCRFHNDLAARQAFGDGWMDRFTRGREPSLGEASLRRAALVGGP